MSATPPTAIALTNQSLLAQVVAGVAATNAQYSSLFRPGLRTHPLLYWGDPTTAQVATFGVNPSAAEFTTGRWPQSCLTVAQLDNRLINYFNNPHVPPHRWFDGYENALNILGHSYKRQNKRDTVHLDLSPRATKAMGTLNDTPLLRTLFLQMVSADLQWFLSALALCRNIRGAIMSGTVTNAYYFDKFLLSSLPPSHSLKLKARFGTGTGATALYDLIGPTFKIPVFFCRRSPSDPADKGVLLASEIQRNLFQLKTAGF
jgi:hypothetical protein